MQGLLSFGKSIREFKSNSNEPLFPLATSYPAFFDKHLVHPNRRIKALLNDPNANIRAFYFQYLMLCYQIENQNFEFYISKIQKFLLDPNFTFLFLEEDDEKIFNDKQFKRFLLEFMEMLDSCEYDTVEAALNAYPIADIAFVYFFRSLAIYAELTADFDSYIDKTNLFGFLLENFNIDAQIFQEKCIKFIEAEVFVYEESPAQIYLVYKEIDGGQSEANNSKLSQSKKSMGSMVDSKKDEHESQQQVQQNISMLEQQQHKSNPNSSQNLPSPVHPILPTPMLNHNPNILTNINSSHSIHAPNPHSNPNDPGDTGFKKNKILDNDDAYKKITEEFEQKPSLFSCNDDLGESQLASQVDLSSNGQRIEYSFKASDQDSHILNPNNNQNSSYNNHPEYQPPHITGPQSVHSSASKNTPTKYQNQYGLKMQQNAGRNNGNASLYGKDEKYSHGGSVTTGTGRDYGYEQGGYGYGYGQQRNSQVVHDVVNRDKNAYSHYVDTHSATGTATGAAISSRNHSNTITQKPTLYTPTPYSDPIPHINTHIHLNIQQPSISTPTASTQHTPPPAPHYQKLNILPEHPHPHQQPQPQSNNKNYQDYSHSNYGYGYNYSYKSQFSSTHVPATRDVPTPDYQARYLYEGKVSGMSGNTSSRESLTQGITLKDFGRAEGQPKASQHIENMTPFQSRSFVNMNPYQPSLKSPKPDPQITLFNPRQPQSHTKSPALTQTPSPSPASTSQKPKQSPYEAERRDLRQQSISTKEQLRQMIASKLSVSKEFTDSLTLMKMGQPYSSNIRKMKTRSREFRQSILTAIK